MLIVCNTAKATMRGKSLVGYIQKFDVAPDFCLSLQCEEQLDSLKRIPENQRFLHVDATGGLVKITKFMNKNYGIVSISY